MSRPRIITDCVADAYVGPDERIIEYAAAGPNAPGGLISLAHDPGSGKLTVSAYRHDARVHALAGAPAEAAGLPVQTSVGMGECGRAYATVRIGRAEITIYESLVDAGAVCVEIDGEFDERHLAVHLNDAPLFDTRNRSHLEATMYVKDPRNSRAWGPFASLAEAKRFIAETGDHYLFLREDRPEEVQTILPPPPGYAAGQPEDP
jgi:hypothetical protein